ncbi:hypothetical protein UFOVP607_13 [uncultured Caudovirales phage]|uniref:Uncharacterized protein n=1 Tax=uncultured Caudovirales phage TaxID=2100421 RepID=A0A6J5MZX7_9CAUD|nr:hypothetical protein UFOVP607_13 [uncultured Caudovirales phage]
MNTKKCFKCHCEKPMVDFYNHSAMADGKLNKCKECTKSDVLKHRLANLEEVRAYDKFRSSMPHRVAARKEYAKTPAYAKSHAEAALRWSAAHPERRSASIAVSNAIRDRRIERLPCLVCGDKAQGHHPGYSRPLDVVWLCAKHHSEVHHSTI